MGLKPYYRSPAGDVVLYLGDCREVLPLLPDESFDLVLADPPYNAGKTYGAHDDDMHRPDYLAWLAGVLAECRRVSRDGVVYFPGTRNVWDVGEVLAAARLRPVRMLGWHKREYAGDKWAGGPATCWEPVVWASKLEKPFFNRRYGTAGRDFLVIGATSRDPRTAWHPCPKHLGVMQWLLGLFCPPGGSVLDPFAGTGTTLRAARDLGLSAAGVECEERFCAGAVRLLAQGTLPGVFAGVE